MRYHFYLKSEVRLIARFSECIQRPFNLQSGKILLTTFDGTFLLHETIQNNLIWDLMHWCGGNMVILTISATPGSKKSFLTQ